MSSLPIRFEAHTPRKPAPWCAVVGALAALALPSAAAAQDAETTGTPPPAAVAAEPAPAPAQPEPLTTESQHESEAAIEAQASVPAPEETEPLTIESQHESEAAIEEQEEESGLDKFMKKVTIGAGLRTGLDLRFPDESNNSVSLSLNDGLVDQINIRPYISAALTEHVGVFMQFEIGTPNGLGVFHILDAMAQIKIVDELQIWVGQHIPANDRNNMNGPFFGNTWNFAITVPSYSFDTGARDRGVTVWGLIADGILKYHLSLVDLQPGQKIQNSRFAGRVTLNLLDPENYYYASGTYWGTQDTLAIGAVYQHQTGQAVNSDRLDPTSPVFTDNDFNGFSFDLFFEKVLTAGTFTLEAGYWNWESVGAEYLSNQGTVDQRLGVAGPLPGSAGMGVLSYLTPKEIGPGKIQANFRTQYGKYDTNTTITYDAGLAYVVDGFDHKYALNYRHQDIDPVGGPAYTEDSIQVGFQYQVSK